METSIKIEAQVLLKVLNAVCDCINRDTDLPLDSKYAFRAKEASLCIDLSLEQIIVFYSLVQQVQAVSNELDNYHLGFVESAEAPDQSGAVP
jgi:hypothetical protein